MPKGRPKGSKNRQSKADFAAQSVAAFDAKGNDGSAIFNKKNLHLIDKDVVAKFDMKQVSSPANLSGNITWFSGKDYEQSLKMAYEWAEYQTRRSETHK